MPKLPGLLKSSLWRNASTNLNKQSRSSKGNFRSKVDPRPRMKVAVVGCCHGELDIIYETIQKTENSVDLVLICGDFQAIRCRSDLDAMACPSKYKVMGDFHQYFEGTKLAPFPTIFIGGNHESSEFMLKLRHGGWVCPNIYFLGQTGVVNFRGLRIAGVSGIYNERDYPLRHWEKIPLQGGDIRSVYHYRYEDILKLSLLGQPVDVFLSHDWPNGIWDYGDRKSLLQWKPFFKTDMSTGKLGSLPLQFLLSRLMPRYWFSAHLHVRFPASVTHSQSGFTTEFLALDKCLPKRKFLEIVNIPVGATAEDFRIEGSWIRKAMAFYRTLDGTLPTNPDFPAQYQRHLSSVGEMSDFNLWPENPNDLAAFNQKIAELFQSNPTNPEELDV